MMAHVSKIALPKKVRERIDTQLVNVLAKRWTKNGKTAVLYELLTKTEKLMLAKRIAIIAMIEAKCTSYEVGQALGVGSATVQRFRKQYLAGTYKNITKILNDKNSRGDFWDTIELFIRVGMPAKGVRRSKTFRKIESIEREQKKRHANPRSNR